MSVSSRPRHRHGAGPVVAGLILFFLILFFLTGVALACFAALPGPVRAAPFSWLVSFHRSISVAALVGVVIITVIVRLRRAGRALTIAAAAAGAVVAVSVIVTFIPWAATTAIPRDPPPRGGLTILSWNTRQQAVTVEQIRTLVARAEPQIVVLPEYSGSIAEGQFQDLRPAYTLYWSERSAASVLVRSDVGAYRVTTTGVPPWAGFALEPLDTAAPPLVIAHLQHSEVLDPTTWLRDLDWAASACATPESIAIGDFNASTENLPGGRLGVCDDVAAALGKSRVGTWPTVLPAFLGAQIDHVFAGARWKPVRFQVLSGQPVEGSDHRPILVSLVVRPE